MDLSYIIIPIIVGITSQVLKLLTDGIKGNFDLKNLYENYGGLPSSHTAFSTSITALIGLRLGLTDPIFGVALVFTLLIIRDAMGFRNMLGKQAKTFNLFIDQLPAGQKKIPRFREQIGHSPIEVIAGIIWGVGLTYFLFLL